jgi:hypothetical protein
MVTIPKSQSRAGAVKIRLVNQNEKRELPLQGMRRLGEACLQVRVFSHYGGRLRPLRLFFSVI